MEKETASIPTFKQRINSARQKAGAGILLGTGIFWALFLLIATDYFEDVNLVALLTVIFTVNTIMIIQLFYKNPGKKWLFISHSILHLCAVIAIPLFLPPVAPHTLFVAVFAFWVYVDFGKKGLVTSLFFQLTGISIMYAFLGKLTNFQDTAEFAAHYTLIMAFTYYMSIFFDITTDELNEVERSTQKISFEHERLMALVANMDDAVLICDSELNIVLANPATLGILNTHEDIVGVPLKDYLFLEDQKGPISLSQIIEQPARTFVSSDYKMRLGKDDFMSLYLAVTRVKLATHSEQNYVIVIRDITKEKSLEDERNEFISIMSHELRTPISIVEGGISLAQSMTASGNTENISKYLQKAHDQTAMLAEIVNSLSTLVHNETQGTGIEMHEIDAAEVAYTLKANYEAEANAKGLSIKATITPDTPKIITNKEYLYEILQNFVTNAIKYTKSGGSIEVNLSHFGDERINFSVKDTGIGMNSADQKHIFEKFWRSEDYQTRESNGTGLGLYITKKLADSLGATITLESEPAKGSTFTISLPVTRTT